MLGRHNATLALVMTACGDGMAQAPPPDAAPAIDARPPDASSLDATLPDSMLPDVVPLDAVPPDAVQPDAVPPDAVPPDAQLIDGHLVLSPATASVLTGATEQFTAMVENLPNAAVTWSVKGTTGSSSEVGTVSVSGLYRAPSALPYPDTVTITATSVADATKSATATVTVMAIQVAVTPAVQQVETGATQQFVAVVSNTPDTSVSWSVGGIIGGDATVGTISVTGLYTAPYIIPSPNRVVVKATSIEDPTKSASATVGVEHHVGLPPPQASVLSFFGQGYRNPTFGMAPGLALGPAFTLTAWVYVQASPAGASNSDGQVMGTTPNGLAAPWLATWIGFAADSFQFVMTTDAGGAQVTSTPVDFDRWTHVAATFGAGTLTLYVDGESVGTATFPNAAGNAHVGVFSMGAGIGAPSATGPPSITGAIRQATVWSRVLTAQEASASAAIYLTGSEPGLLAFWPLDDPSFLSARDLTSNRHDLSFGRFPDGTTCPGCRPRPEPPSFLTSPYFAITRLDGGVPTNSNGCMFDANGDGYPDVIFGESQGPTWPPLPMHVLVNDGSGDFTLGDASIFGSQTIDMELPRNCVVADFDGDGSPDVFLAGTGPDTAPDPGEQSRILMQRGSGLVDESVTRLPSEMAYTHGVAVADVDRNGAPDLFLARCCAPGPTSGFYMNDGSGHFRADDARYPADAEHNELHAVFADFNLDGHLDLLTADASYPYNGSSAPDYLLVGDSTGHFGPLPGAVPDFPGPRTLWGNSYVAVADFDGDGYPDLVMPVNGRSDTDAACGIELLLNNGDGTFRDETKRFPPVQLPPEAVQAPFSACGYSWVEEVDLNGDGKPDIFAPGSTAGVGPVLFLNSGDGHFIDGSAALGAFPGGDRGLVGDLDKDGRSDLFLFTSSSIYWTARQLRPFVVPGPARTPTVTGLAPASAEHGSPGVTLTVTGSGFVLGATVLWNQSARPTEFVDESTLRVAVLATDLTAPTSASITVTDPGAPTSGAISFRVP